MACRSNPLTQEQKVQTTIFFKEIYNFPLKGGGIILDDANFNHRTMCRSVSGMINQARRDILNSGVSFASVNIYKATRNGYYRRNEEFLWRFNHIVIDIDYQADFSNNYCDLEERLEQSVLWHCDSYGIPLPTQIVFSGSGGCHLYYLFESLPNGAAHQMQIGIQATKMKLVAKWVEAEKGLDAYGPGFKVDVNATDSSRVFRVPGSIHEDTGRMCRIIKTGVNTYKYKSLCAALEERPWNGAYALMSANLDIELFRNGHMRKIAFVKTPPKAGMTAQWLGAKRLNELFLLARSGWGFINCREKTSHLAWIWARDAGFSMSECEDKLRQLNEYFHMPLRERELFHIAKGNGKSYWYTNERIRFELGLDVSDGYFVNFRSREFKDREGKAKLHKKLISTMVLIGKKISEIACELHLSISLVKRRRSQMKKMEGFDFWAAVKI